ncbi:MAG: hypothetical protein H6834_12470 [Planctomycetes bacterium]|nr:hypothetical protein [Planctomycetota bacterium]
MHRLLSVWTGLAVSLLLLGSTSAQIAPGSWVTAHLSSATGGPGGIWVHDALGASSQPILGLSGELTGAGQTLFGVGASCVALVEDPSVLYVGEITALSSGNGTLGTLDLHRIVLNGRTVAQDTLVANVPAVSPIGRTHSLSPVHPGAEEFTFLVTTDARTAPGWAMCYHYRANAGGAPGVLTPISVSGFSGFPAQLASDPRRGGFYIASSTNSGATEVSYVPPSSTTATFVATLPGIATSLAWDERTGELVSLTHDPNFATTTIARLDPRTASYRQQPSTQPVLGMQGSCFEAATGSIPSRAQVLPGDLMRLFQGTPLRVTSPPVAGWGNGPYAIDVRNAPRTFGSASPGWTITARWNLPWSGTVTYDDALPFAGNVRFGLTIDTQPMGSVANGLLAVGTVASNGIPLLNGTLWLDPAHVLATFPIAGTSPSLALPLPLTSSGVTLALQAAFADGFSIVMTEGLWLEIW